jgi:hypothetical protein
MRGKVPIVYNAGVRELCIVIYALGSIKRYDHPPSNDMGY